MQQSPPILIRYSLRDGRRIGEACGLAGINEMNGMLVSNSFGNKQFTFLAADFILLGTRKAL
jgi:hypothetical protein